MENPKVILVTQARMGSTRLPGKVLKQINGKALLEIHLERLQRAKNVDKIIVASTVNEEDEAIIQLANQLKISSFRGAENDVLARYYECLKDYRPEWVVRVTSDCPLIDPALIDAVVSCAVVNDAVYCSNTYLEQFPDGQDIEVFKFSALEKAYQTADLTSDREHVTPYIRKNTQVLSFPCFSNFSQVRMTVDEQVDFDVVEALCNNLGIEATWLDYTNFLLNTDLKNINSQIERNEGYQKSLKND